MLGARRGRPLRASLQFVRRAASRPTCGRTRFATRADAAGSARRAPAASLLRLLGPVRPPTRRLRRRNPSKPARQRNRPNPRRTRDEDLAAITQAASGAPSPRQQARRCRVSSRGGVVAYHADGRSPVDYKAQGRDLFSSRQYRDAADAYQHASENARPRTRALSGSRRFVVPAGNPTRDRRLPTRGPAEARTCPAFRPRSAEPISRKEGDRGRAAAPTERRWSWIRKIPLRKPASRTSSDRLRTSRRIKLRVLTLTPRTRRSRWHLRARQLTESGHCRP